jgi:hypothetical protein
VQYKSQIPHHTNFPSFCCSVLLQSSHHSPLSSAVVMCDTHRHTDTLLIVGTELFVHTSEMFLVTGRQWRTQNFFRGGGVPTNLFEDKGQREWGSRGGSALIRGSTKFANEKTPVFWLGSDGCMFHGTGNLAQLCGKIWVVGPQTP